MLARACLTPPHVRTAKHRRLSSGLDDVHLMDGGASAGSMLRRGKFGQTLAGTVREPIARSVWIHLTSQSGGVGFILFGTSSDVDTHVLRKASGRERFRMGHLSGDVIRHSNAPCVAPLRGGLLTIAFFDRRCYRLNSRFSRRKN